MQSEKRKAVESMKIKTQSEKCKAVESPSAMFLINSSATLGMTMPFDGLPSTGSGQAGQEGHEEKKVFATKFHE